MSKKSTKKPTKSAAKPKRKATWNNKTKLSDREARLLAAFGGIGKVARLTDLGDIAFKRERPHAKRLSWAKNNIRYPLAVKMVQRLKDGSYKRVR